jgi:hypothetical protein
MILPVNDEWRIRSDAFCWTVERLHVPATGKRAGKHVWQAKYYYPSLEMAVQGVCEARLRDIDAEGLEGCLEAIKALQMDVTRLSAQVSLAA